MEHEIFFDGNMKEYSWSLKTENNIVDQIREHPPAFLSGGKLNITNCEESKFVALHVGIYWGLGVKIIKNQDIVNVKCDSEMMFEIMTKGEKSDNEIINDKVYFINQLTNWRELKMNYQFIKTDKNIATKHLFAKEDTAERDSKGYV